MSQLYSGVNTWMNEANLVNFDRKKRVLTRYEPTAGSQEKHNFIARQRVGMTIPWVSYTIVEKVIAKLYEMQQKGEKFDWTSTIGIKESTFSKALTTLEDLDFIKRENQSLEISPLGKDFVLNIQKRPEIFAASALKMEAFAAFVNILQSADSVPSIPELAIELMETLQIDWRSSTAQTYVQTMLNWARYTKLVPKLDRRSQKRTANTQISLFESSKDSISI